MTAARSANLLGALSVAVADRVEATVTRSATENTSSSAALKLIGSFPGCSNFELSRGLKLSHPATVRLLDKLDRQGLVDRRTGVDRRSVALHLTPAGQTRITAVIHRRRDVLLDLVVRLSDQQRRWLDDIAASLLHHLTISPWEAGYICRLCEETDCIQDTCPVHRRAVSLLASEPATV